MREDLVGLVYRQLHYYAMPVFLLGLVDQVEIAGDYDVGVSLQVLVRPIVVPDSAPDCVDVVEGLSEEGVLD